LLTGRPAGRASQNLFPARAGHLQQPAAQPRGLLRVDLVADHHVGGDLAGVGKGRYALDAVFGAQQRLQPGCMRGVQARDQDVHGGA